MTERDLNSDNLFEDLLSEKSYQLDRFTQVKTTPQDELIDLANKQAKEDGRDPEEDHLFDERGT